MRVVGGAVGGMSPPAGVSLERMLPQVQLGHGWQALDGPES